MKFNILTMIEDEIKKSKIKDPIILANENTIKKILGDIRFKASETTLENRVKMTQMEYTGTWNGHRIFEDPNLGWGEIELR